MNLRTETFKGLYHGTDKTSANEIRKNGFLPSTDINSWCGSGVYFYDIKAKAWWAAGRKCDELKVKTKAKIKPVVITADLMNIPKERIFDLRSYNDLIEFEKIVDSFCKDRRLEISNLDENIDRKIEIRAMLIGFFAQEQRKQLIIGAFMQRPQEKYLNVIKFANGLDMIFGIETIYCVKDISVIENIT